MQHKNYYEVEAKSNYELGTILGGLFKSISRKLINEEASKSTWGAKVDKAKQYLDITEHYFPQYIKELKGYAVALEADFIELWTRSLEDEFDEELGIQKCTTFITNGGNTLAHNEDWEKDSGNQLCLLKKTIGSITIFEIYYFNTLGGNAVSVNSYGFAQTINTLHHSDRQIGVPRNVIGRFFEETSDPERDFKKLANIKRSSGFNHVILGKDGVFWNIECSAAKQMMIRPKTPFIHTNHFLSKLKSFETNDKVSTRVRLGSAQSLVKEKMEEEEIKNVMNNADNGPKNSISNVRTVAKVIIDLKENLMRIWLKREKEAGWVDYEIDFK